VSQTSSGAIWERAWPISGIEHVETCPICGSSDRSVELDGMVDNAFGVAPGRWTLKRCGRCRAAYLDPRPTPDSIGAAYAQYYTHATLAPPPTGGLLRRLYRLVADRYVKGRFRDSGLAAGLLARLIALLAEPLANRQDSRHRWMDRYRPGMSLLDVGCGSGDFLKIAQDIGWRVEGLDLDEQAVSVARGLGVTAHAGDLASLDGSLSGPFDVITMNHVIEHVYDPRRDLERVHELLKPGGLLFLETPNIDALNLRRFGIHWRGLEAPRHLTLFNPQSLKVLLREIGFDRIKVRRHIVFDGMFRDSAAIEAVSQGAKVPRRASLGMWVKGHLASTAGLEFITITARRRR